MFTFAPKFLFEQFRRYANVFFLFIALLQVRHRQSPLIKNKAAIALQCKLNGKLIAALFFIPYSSQHNRWLIAKV